MPEKATTQRAKRQLRKGKKPSTAAGEFVREEMEHIREGKHGARSSKQAIAIGLSKARRAGVPLDPPKRGRAKPSTRRTAERDLAAGRRGTSKPSAKRSRASTKALKREGRGAATKKSLSKQAKSTARKRPQRRASR